MGLLLGNRPLLGASRVAPPARRLCYIHHGLASRAQLGDRKFVKPAVFANFTGPHSLDNGCREFSVPRRSGVGFCCGGRRGWGGSGAGLSAGRLGACCRQCRQPRGCHGGRRGSALGGRRLRCCRRLIMRAPRNNLTSLWELGTLRAGPHSLDNGCREFSVPRRKRVVWGGLGAEERKEMLKCSIRVQQQPGWQGIRPGPKDSVEPMAVMGAVYTRAEWGAQICRTGTVFAVVRDSLTALERSSVPAKIAAKEPAENGWLGVGSRCPQRPFGLFIAGTELLIVIRAQNNRRKCLKSERRPAGRFLGVGRNFLPTPTLNVLNSGRGEGEWPYSRPFQPAIKRPAGMAWNMSHSTEPRRNFVSLRIGRTHWLCIPKRAWQVSKRANFRAAAVLSNTF